MRNVLCLGLLMALGCSGFAQTPQAPSKAEFKTALDRLADLESRVAKLEGRTAAVGTSCPCPDGGRCVCGPVCPCEAKTTAAPKLVQWTYQGSTCRPPEGYSIPGGVRAGPATAPAGWDCSSGVCRPASSAAAYGSSGVTYGGSCSGGSCGTSYGGGYGAFPPSYGFGSAGSSGGCAGGSCGSPASSFGGFRRR